MSDKSLTWKHEPRTPSRAEPPPVGASVREDEAVRSADKPEPSETIQASVEEATTPDVSEDEDTQEENP